jgi:hypothetical protein
MTTETLIRCLLDENNRSHAIPLFDAIRTRASNDNPFKEHFTQWLDEGGTLLLRDELCAPFKDADFINAQTDRRYPWHDAWTAIDSARLQARDLRLFRNNFRNDSLLVYSKHQIAEDSPQATNRRKRENGSPCTPSI